MTVSKNSKRINITVPKELYAEAKKCSLAEGKSFSGLVQELLQLYVFSTKEEERKFL